MSKNFLKITTILCSFSSLFTGVALAKYNDKTNRNSQKELYNNGDGTYTYESQRGVGEIEYGGGYEESGVVKDIYNEGNGTTLYDKSRSREYNGKDYNRNVNNTITMNSDGTKSVTRSATTAQVDGGGDIENGVTVSSSDGATTVTKYQDGTEENQETFATPVSATKDSNGGATITTSGGKSRTVTKPKSSSK